MSPLPDCLVVGGGVIGLNIARHLVGEGLRVTLLDRSACGSEASWAGAGILSPCNPHRDDPLFHLQERSLSLYPALCGELLDETGVDPEYDPCGELALLFTENTVSIARSDVQAAAGRTMPDGQAIYALHESTAARQLEPALGPGFLAAMECRQTAQVRNPRLLRALVESCRRRGVNIVEGLAVAGLIREGQRVTGVRTGSGPHRAGAVILCAGAWSAQLDPALAEIIPVFPVRGQIALVKCERRPFQRVLTSGRYYLVPRRDGHVLIGATEERDAGFVKRNTPRGIAKLMEKALRIAPSLADAPVEATWAGLRPGTPDDKPYIGPVPGMDGLFAATGHFRSGLTLAPANAEAIACIVLNRACPIDISALRPGRN